MAASSGLAPTITATGITAGNFAQWYAYIVSQYQGIFGADGYIDPDSQDGQFIAVIAQAIADVCASAVAVYNSFSPATAQGAGLSSNVKINGLKRLVPTYSVTPFTIGGIANTTITNGLVIDSNQVVWALPTLTTISSTGSVTVTGTCTTLGAISIGSSISIQNPVYGWQSASIAGSSTLGAVVESDATLRVRQNQSVSLPSVTIFEGIVANIEQVPGVTRAKGYENNTSATNGNGIPAHTLYFLVEGGSQANIFNAIFEKITSGIPTQGSISTTITDSNGSTRLLKYDTPTDATISVVLTVTPLSGWNSSTKALIQAAVVNFLQALPIGANISFFNGLLLQATLQGTPYFGTFNITGMTLQKNSGSVVSADIQLNYNEAAVASATNVTFSGV